jgi:hypothetical protein
VGAAFVAFVLGYEQPVLARRCGHGMILTGKGVDIEDATYRVIGRPGSQNIPGAER